MHETSTVIDKYGRIVIPASLRKRLGVRAGDKVVIIPRDNELLIISRKARRDAAIERLRQALSERATGRDLTEELIEERRQEALDD